MAKKKKLVKDKNEGFILYYDKFDGDKDLTIIRISKGKGRRKKKG